MKQLGYLEETVLLLLLSMKAEAYGFSVCEAYQRHTGKEISLSAVHTVLSRLEKKGLIRSAMGGATEVRGGRRKRIFEPTPLSLEVVKGIKASRQQLWKLIPDLS